MKSDQCSENCDNKEIISSFNEIRSLTLDLCRPLNRDDYMVQATPEVSPPKWHLGHTTWFFENFILRPFSAGYKPFDEKYMYLFNSYYETVGEFLPKPMRSTISRPDLDDVLNYRSHANEAVADLMANLKGDDVQEVKARMTLGINHEQQHQELLMMDIKMNYSVSPYLPAYASSTKRRNVALKEQGWISYDETTAAVGYEGSGFCFDNELPSTAN